MVVSVIYANGDRFAFSRGEGVESTPEVRAVDIEIEVTLVKRSFLDSAYQSLLLLRVQSGFCPNIKIASFFKMIKLVLTSKYVVLFGVVRVRPPTVSEAGWGCI